VLAAKTIGETDKVTMLREYDFTVITKGELAEADAAKALASYEALMALEGGEILRKEEWGNKKLNFPIKKSFRGYYTNYDFVGAPSSVAEMERLMRIDDNVLRYIVMRTDTNKDGNIDIEVRKTELAQAERDAREAEAKKRKE